MRIFPKSKPTSGVATSMRRWAGRLAPLMLLLSLAAEAKTDCYGSVCVEQRSGPGYTDLRGVNRNAFPVMLKLGLQPGNMRADSDVDVFLLPPGETVPLLRLSAENPAEPPSFRTRVSWARGDASAVHDDSYVYALPYHPGLGFKVTQSYNGRFSHHDDARYAIDFDMPEGTPVFAAREGRVVAVEDRFDEGGPHRKFEALANYVVIQHPDGTFGEYLHLQAKGVKVKVGDLVQRGQQIGLSGNTGFSSGPHLHFMVAGATEDGLRRSYPARFRTSEGIVAELQRGRSYRHMPDDLPNAGGVEGLADVIEASRQPAAPGAAVEEGVGGG